MYKYTDADKLIEILARNRVRILKECAEWIGLSMGPIINKIEYHNYLANKPLSYFVPGGEAYDRLLLEGEYIWVHDGNSIDTLNSVFTDLSFDTGVSCSLGKDLKYVRKYK